MLSSSLFCFSSTVRLTLSSWNWTSAELFRIITASITRHEKLVSTYRRRSGVIFCLYFSVQTVDWVLSVGECGHSLITFPTNVQVTFSKWKVPKYIYSSTVLKHNLEVLVLYLSFYIFCYSYSTTIQWEILYFLLNYINLIPLVTLQNRMINTKWNPQINYDVLLSVKIKLYWSWREIHKLPSRL